MQIDLTPEQYRTQAISNGFTENISNVSGFEATIEQSNGFGENHKHWMCFSSVFKMGVFQAPHANLSVPSIANGSHHGQSVLTPFSQAIVLFC